ncbi:50S ribosome-binding GTPase [Escherichia coli]|nr:50S ribosome-binding GTPase [Escherichia coli]MBA8194062.1 50S ribosome-binding GTPase [Escherichia coli]MBA8246440.1 50S ribosome-binding GTPase [Escherichia coli]QMB48242.1 50S ribosome-binding GTPase [Escherichia coli]QMB52850.1 50S ribosome-binding GTPase [Escherichia coli]
MGKSGAGKSSLCNTLFSPPPASVDAIRGCTRHVHRYQVTRGPRTLHIADFPGIAETPEPDRQYRRLYRAWAPKLDLIVWALKADDRAWKDDLRCYRELLGEGAAPERFLFVLTQADKMEPCREWDNANHQPSPRQTENLRAKTQLAATLFATVHPVIAVSAAENYHLEQWAEALIKALPVSSSSAVFRHLNPELRTEYVQETARESFVHATGDIFDEAVAAIQTSGRLVRRLQRLRLQFLAVIRAVWHLLF